MRDSVDRVRVFGDTGEAIERIAPGYGFWPTLEEEHLARYRWAARRVRGRTVLDVACGTGYGSQVLRRAGARAVVSVDISEDALRFGARRYEIAPVRADAGSIPLAASAFDAAVSFETVEHVTEPERFLGEIARLLRPGGLLLLSTPNTLRSSGDNPYHVKEYELGELRSLLAALGFAAPKVSGQRWGVWWSRLREDSPIRKASWRSLEQLARPVSLRLPLLQPMFWCLSARKRGPAPRPR